MEDFKWKEEVAMQICVELKEGRKFALLQRREEEKTIINFVRFCSGEETFFSEAVWIDDCAGVLASRTIGRMRDLG